MDTVDIGAASKCDAGMRASRVICDEAPPVRAGPPRAGLSRGQRNRSPCLGPRIPKSTRARQVVPPHRQRCIIALLQGGMSRGSRQRASQAASIPIGALPTRAVGRYLNARSRHLILRRDDVDGDQPRRAPSLTLRAASSFTRQGQRTRLI